MDAAAGLAGHEKVVVRWIKAIDDGDVEGALACLDPAVTFHPLRLGVTDACHGHDGVRRWFARLAREARQHRIELLELRHTEGPELLAAGTLGYAGEPAISPFCGVHRRRPG